MSLTVRATCLFAPPPPVAADMKETTEKIMAHLLGSDDVTDPTVEGDPVSETMAIEIDVDADELISAFARGRQRILEAIAGAGWKVETIDHELKPEREPKWEIDPHTGDDRKLVPVP